MGFGAAAAREAMLSDAEAQRCSYVRAASMAYLDESACAAVRALAAPCCARMQGGLAACKTLASS